MIPTSDERTTVEESGNRVEAVMIAPDTKTATGARSPV